MRITTQDLMKAMFGVGFLTACIAGQLRGDLGAALRVAVIVQVVGLVAAAVRYAHDRSRGYLMALGILGFLLAATSCLLIAERR